MVLDIYLIQKYYIGANYEHRKITGSIDLSERGKKLSIDFKKVRYIDCEVIHMESALMIHDWFVEQIQDGEDDCKQYYVDREKIKELLDICNRVIENRDLADELLPTRKAFYYENGRYNEAYFYDLERFVGMLNELDLEGEDLSFEYYYESAW